MTLNLTAIRELALRAKGIVDSTTVPELAEAVLGLLEENKTALKQHYELCCEIERAKAQYEALKAENAKLRAVAEVRCRHLPDALAALDEEPHEKDHY